jgi:HSP20 family protein
MTTEIQERATQIDPWTDFERSFEDLRSRVFGALGYGLPAFLGEPVEPGWQPARLDVTDSGTAFQIVAEVPGIPKEKLDIRVRGGRVEIRGEHTTSTETKDGPAVLRRERTYAGYYRSVELPEPVVAADAKVKLENGLLELTLPKETPSPAEGEVRIPIP